MGGTNTTPNVTLDFSQSQPVQQPAPQGQPGGAVTLDFSKAEPTVVSMVGPQGEKQQVPVENVTAMRQKNYAVTSDNPGVTKMSSPEGKTTYALPSEVDQFKASGHVVNAYKEHFNFQTGKMEYTYTPGQKGDAKHPEMSYDDQGNVYYKGAPLKLSDTTPLVPTPGLSTLASSAARTVGATATRVLGREIVKQVGTGLYDSAGREIMKEVSEKALPRILSGLGPKALKIGLGGGGSILGVKWLSHFVKEGIHKVADDVFSDELYNASGGK